MNPIIAADVGAACGTVQPTLTLSGTTPQGLCGYSPHSRLRNRIAKSLARRGARGGSPGHLALASMHLTTVLLLSSPGQKADTSPIPTPSSRGTAESLPLPCPPPPSAYPPVRGRSSPCGTHAARASGRGRGVLHSCQRKDTECG